MDHNEEVMKNISGGMASELEWDNHQHEVTVLLTQIREMWRRLKTDEKYYEKYTGLFEKSILRMQPTFVLQALKEELARCEEEKKANIKSYMTALRTELKELWGKCLVKEEDQEAIFKSTVYSEAVMKACELELQKRKEFYDSNKNMILAIHNYEAAWFTWKDLVETIEKDTNRFKNRKGTLLEQEKDKKAAKHNVYKAQVIIQKLDAKFLEEHGRNFTVRGQSVHHYIQDEKSLKAMEMDEKKTKRVSTQRGRPSSRLPSATNKRYKASLIPKLTRTTSTQVLRGLNTTEVLRRRSAKLRKAKVSAYTPSSNANAAVESHPEPGPSSSRKN